MEQNVTQSDNRSRVDPVQDPSLLNGVPIPIESAAPNSGTEMAVEPVRARPYDPNSFCDDYLTEGTCHGY